MSGTPEREPLNPPRRSYGMVPSITPFLTVIRRGDLRLRVRCWIRGHDWLPIHPNTRCCNRCAQMEEWRGTLDC